MQNKWSLSAKFSANRHPPPPPTPQPQSQEIRDVKDVKSIYQKIQV